MIAEICVLLLAYLIFYVYYNYKKTQRKFECAGLKFHKGLPLFGNNWRSMFLRRHVVDDFGDVYKAFPNERYVGYIEGMRPIILVRDHLLMKDILVKDFQHFSDRKEFFPERLDPLLGRSITSINGIKWRDMRMKQNPAFTTNKIKFMMNRMSVIAKEVVENLKDHESEDLDIGLPMYRYCGEGSMYSAFDVRESKEREDEENVFVKIGMMYKFNIFNRVLYFISMQFPTIGMIFKHLGVTLFPEKTQEFFLQTMRRVLEYRKGNSINVPDYLQVLLETVDEWSIEEIAGQAVFAFIASFDTASHNLSLLFHELALHPDVQEKLYQEIRRHKEVERDLKFSDLRELKYMNCVLNETLRKWSASLVIDRICTKPYLLPPPREGGMPYLINPGDWVYCIINPLHNDSNHFPSPETFDPERFSEENKHNIKPCTFVPFGMGPRGCLGERFARTLMLVMIYHLVLNFNIKKCAKTTNPIRIQPDEFKIKSDGGSWVKLEART